MEMTRPRVHLVCPAPIRELLLFFGPARAWTESCSGLLPRLDTVRRCCFGQSPFCLPYSDSVLVRKVSELEGSFSERNSCERGRFMPASRPSRLPRRWCAWWFGTCVSFLSYWREQGGAAFESVPRCWFSSVSSRVEVCPNVDCTCPDSPCVEGVRMSSVVTSAVLILRLYLFVFLGAVVCTCAVSVL
ncbi:hypothetical protein BaRGS_00010972 [Batillaria attramentaria]|uniref:Transmembrane protein n=1 Tax=Batillaria attramentaria TaxID=370345 RepID=A0ABD0LFE5_9CAEN